MSRPIAEFRPSLRGTYFRPGAVIRIGEVDTCHGGAVRKAMRLTVAEAEVMQMELAAAIAKAKAAKHISPPEPPPANTGALEAA
jgi:hypothetical protein